jgi:hypothetical protein
MATIVTQTHLNVSLIHTLPVFLRSIVADSETIIANCDEISDMSVALIPLSLIPFIAFNYKIYFSLLLCIFVILSEHLLTVNSNNVSQADLMYNVFKKS